MLYFVKTLFLASVDSCQPRNGVGFCKVSDFAAAANLQMVIERFKIWVLLVIDKLATQQFK